jgi:hypothetical protein
MTMQDQDTVQFVRWLAKIDPRIMYGPEATEAWHHALANISPGAAKMAVMEYKRLYPTAPTPSDIATRAKQLQASRAAKQRALQAQPAQPSDQLPLRKRDPQRWEALIQAGKQEAAKAKKERAA